MREKRGRVFIHIAPCPPSHPSPNSPQKGSLGTLPFCQYPYTPASLPMSISEEYRIKTWQRQREPARSQRASSRHKQLLPPDADLAPLPAARRHSRLHCPRSFPSRPLCLPLLSSGRENGEGQSQTLEDATRARDGQRETEKGREVTMHRLQPPAPWAPGDRGGCVKLRAVDSLRDLKVRIRND